MPYKTKHKCSLVAISGIYNILFASLLNFGHDRVKSLGECNRYLASKRRQDIPS